MSEYWQTERKELWEQNEYILQQSLWTDCTFEVGDEIGEKQTFHFHKVMLSKASPVFETMFYGALPETQIIKITDIQPEIFKKLIRYIYTHEIEPLGDYEDILALCYAAKKYMLQDIVDTCVHEMWDELTPSNVCQGYEFATEMEVPKMQDRCMKMIQNNTTAVIEDLSFVNIEHSTLVEILKQDTLMISSEVILIQAAEHWAENEIKTNNNETIINNNKQEILGIAFSHLRFLALTIDEFLNSGIETELLNDSEKINILKMKKSDNVISINDKICLIKSNRILPINDIIFENVQTRNTNFDTKTKEYILEFRVPVPVYIIGAETAVNKLAHDFHSSSSADHVHKSVLILQDITNFTQQNVTISITPLQNRQNKIIQFDKPVKIYENILYRLSIISENLMKEKNLVDISKNTEWLRFVPTCRVSLGSVMNIIYKNAY